MCEVELSVSEITLVSILETMSHLDYEVKDKLVQLEGNPIIIQVSQLHPCQFSIDVLIAFTILRELHVTVCR